MHIPCATHLNSHWFDHPKNILRTLGYKLWSFVSAFPLFPPFWNKILSSALRSQAGLVYAERRMGIVCFVMKRTVVDYTSKLRLLRESTLRCLPLSHSQSHVRTDGQPVGLSWCRWPDINYVWKLQSCQCGAPSLTRSRVCRLSWSVMKSIVSIDIRKTIHNVQELINDSNTIFPRPLSVQAQYSRLCPISSSFRYNGSLVTWTAVWLTAAKFKPLVFPVSGFALSNVANIFIVMI
jgi:hypothetical protein